MKRKTEFICGMIGVGLLVLISIGYILLVYTFRGDILSFRDFLCINGINIIVGIVSTIFILLRNKYTKCSGIVLIVCGIISIMIMYIESLAGALLLVLGIMLVKNVN